jgi:N-acyl-D-glutamate deacylase
MTNDSASETHDIVLANGRVIDPETYMDAQMHVGITGDRIVTVSETALKGKEVIDVSGMIVAPGFIDMHAHGQDIAANRMQAFDGVTTALELEGDMLPVSKYYADTAKEGRPLNFGISAGWIGARIIEMSPQAAVNGKLVPTIDWIMASFAHKEWVEKIADDTQIAKITGQIEQGLKEGALGIGLPYGYAPGAGTKEIVEVCKMAAKYGVPTFSHVQNMGVLDPHSAIESYIKVFGFAAATGADMHICHLNSTSSRDVDKAVPLIIEAQKAGLGITMGAYTYGTAESAMGAAEWDPVDVQARIGVDWSDFTRIKDMKSMGSKEELIQARKDGPGDWTTVRMLHEDEDTRDKSLLDMSVLFPGGVIETDAVPWTRSDGTSYKGKDWPLPEGLNSHPRSAGCYSRFLRKWVRERAVISWMDAIRKASLNPAQIMGKGTPMMHKKGRLQVGLDADIIVFDPEAVTEKATFKDSCQTSAGMKHVLVNGTLLIRDEQLDTEAFPGRPMRRPVTA